MSTKNFVSYGDAESLMSGIKDAIDGAGGGGGSLEKVVVATSNVTNQTVAQALEPFLNAFKQLTDEQRRCCFIDIYGTGVLDGATARLYFIATQGADNSISKIFFGSRATSDGGFCAIVTASYSMIYIANTAYQSNTLASQGWTKFELSYMTYRSAVVPSVGDTLVYEPSDYSVTVSTAMSNMLTAFNALTDEQKIKSYIFMKGDGNNSANNTLTLAKYPFSRITNNDYIVFYDQNNYIVYLQIGQIYAGSNSPIISTFSLTGAGISHIGLYISE